MSPDSGTWTRRASGSGIGIAASSARRVRVHRVGEQIGPVRGLHDAAQIHDADLVADVLDDAEVVADEEHGDTELALQPRHQVQDLRLHADVEGAHGLVGHDEFGLAGQRRGDPHPLPLAAGQRRGMAVGVVG